MPILNKPSFYATGITGISIILILLSYIYSPKNINFLIFATILSILIGIHGLLHLGLEIKYNFDTVDVVNVINQIKKSNLLNQPTQPKK
jgi:hypothetical protein